MATVVLAGGGTAGHIEPALAVAREWIAHNPTDRCRFIGTSYGLESTLIPAAGFELALIPKVRISRKPSMSWLRVPIDLITAVRASSKALHGADVLVGFGGYVSAPAYIAAALKKVPIVIHEANAKAGWANRLGSLFTGNLAVAGPVDSGKFADALLSGLPLRSDVAEAFERAGNDWIGARKQAKIHLGFDPDAPLIFVMGGSQGSIAINAIIAANVNLFESLGYSTLHSVGRNNELPETRGSYKPVAYVEAMADAYLAADLIIARSGAVTCSEFRALGRYALFVPLPIGNGEQFVNALTLVKDGRAQILDQKLLTSGYLANHIKQLIELSSLTSVEGDGQDLHAAEKICSLMRFAMNK